jgi:GDPmannose 4,6-dehydratase
VKTALVTGITGQDGSYLVELLLEKGYQVHGIRRRNSGSDPDRLQPLKGALGEGRLLLHYGDLTEAAGLQQILGEVQPDEVYNLAAQSDVAVSFQQPAYTGNVNGLGVVRLLEAVRTTCPGAKVYQASTSEMFGNVEESPQDESTPFRPRSPYGNSKLYAYRTTCTYREAYDLHVSNGILFNHESPRRGTNFVTRKIARGVAEIEEGWNEPLELGNLDGRRDWGYAPEYVRAMWRMMQEDEPDDYVIATGESHTVREFASRSFEVAGRSIRWEGEATQEKGYDRDTGQLLVEVNPEYFRPADVNTLIGDASKAEFELGWTPKTRFNELVELMVRAELEEQV